MNESEPTRVFAAVGRSFRDGPEIDGKVYLGSADAQPGQFVKARITDARAYDLIAEETGG